MLQKLQALLAEDFDLGLIGIPDDELDAWLADADERKKISDDPADAIYLREGPGDYETVRRLIRHKKHETTMQFFAELSSQWAVEHYDDVVLKKFGG